MKSLKTDAVICGAGIAGISAAYHLTKNQGLRDILLVDERTPLSLTSDKSTECYRNWWPGPSSTMVDFMNHSIDLLESLAEESDNYFHMNRRGYVFLTADPAKASALKQSAEEISKLGAGPFRIHRGRPDDPAYPGTAPDGLGPGIAGADFFSNPAHILHRYPFINDRAAAMLHVRRAGWLSAQQLGMYLLDRAKETGVRLLKGRVAGISTGSNRIETIHIQTENGPIEVSTGIFVVAAGPFLKAVGAMMGIDVPVFNELHGKIAFNDPAGIVSRTAPLMIWEDPTPLNWSETERKELGTSEETRWLLDVFPAGVHFRPEGGGTSSAILALWTYDVEAREPVWPPIFQDEYPEIVLRGLARMIPGLSGFLNKMSRPAVDGGYYCKTRENRPLIGPLSVKGAYLIGALSGFGIMASMAAGELLAQHVAGAALPPYAEAFLPNRYEDPEYQKLLADWDAASGQL